MSPAQEKADVPGVVTAPPLLVLVPWLAALALEFIAPTQVLSSPSRWVAGAGLVGVGMWINGWAFGTQKRAGTDPFPFHASTLVVQHGPYRFTRNPMYLGFLLMAAGLSVLVDSWWGIASLPLAFVLLLWGAIWREERYLERKFGESYVDYKSRVRRWL